MLLLKSCRALIYILFQTGRTLYASLLNESFWSFADLLLTDASQYCICDWVSLYGGYHTQHKGKVKREEGVAVLKSRITLHHG